MPLDQLSTAPRDGTEFMAVVEGVKERCRFDRVTGRLQVWRSRIDYDCGNWDTLFDLSGVESG